MSTKTVKTCQKINQSFLNVFYCKISFLFIPCNCHNQKREEIKKTQIKVKPYDEHKSPPTVVLVPLLCHSMITQESKLAVVQNVQFLGVFFLLFMCESRDHFLLSVCLVQLAAYSQKKGTWLFTSDGEKTLPTKKVNSQVHGDKVL